MAHAYDYIAGIIQTAADGAGGTQQLILGTPGSQILWPDNPLEVQQPRDTGQAWTAGSPIEQVASEVGDFLDLCSVSWCKIHTNATGVAPTFDDQQWCSAVSKNEGANTLTVTFDPAYLNANYFANAHIGWSAAGIIRVTAKTTTQFTFYFVPPGGLAVTINNRIVEVIAVGHR